MNKTSTLRLKFSTPRRSMFAGLFETWMCRSRFTLREYSPRRSESPERVGMYIWLHSISGDCNSSTNHHGTHRGPRRMWVRPFLKSIRFPPNRMLGLHLMLRPWITFNAIFQQDEIYSLEIVETHTMVIPYLFKHGLWQLIGWGTRASYQLAQLFRLHVANKSWSMTFM